MWNKLLLVLLLLTNFAKASTILELKKPRSTGYPTAGRGSIDAATIQVEPKGIYTQVDIFLTFSSKTINSISLADSLEIVYKFDLPEGSWITDSWLYAGNTIYQADIIDLYSAQTVYEEVVKRRLDPSILKKLPNGSYELKIFPLVGKQTRRVKITTMIKNNWSINGGFSVNLPLDILNVASTPCFSCIATGVPSYVTLNIQKSNTYLYNALFTKSGTSYTPISTINAEQIRVNSGDFTKDFSVKFKTNAPDGVIFNTYSVDPSTGYYQALIFPNIIFKEVLKGRRTLFLLDYEHGNSTILQEDMWRYFKDYILENYTELDSFAVIFNGGFNNSGPNWIKGDNISKENSLSLLNSDMLGTNGNVDTLLAKGLDFLKNNKVGDVILISSSEYNYIPEQTQNAINFYSSIWPANSKFSAIDLCTKCSPYSRDVIYYGDGYFYYQLSKKLKGSQASIKEYGTSSSNFSVYHTLLTKSIAASHGTIPKFIVSVEPYDGMSYEELREQTISGQLADLPYVEVGSFYTDVPDTILPFKIRNGGTYRKEVAKRLTPSENTVKTTYVGKKIELKKPISNAEIHEVIDLSIKARILTDFTAFLAVDSTLGGTPCVKCKDGPLTALEDQFSKDSLFISVYPTPSTHVASIVIHDPAISKSNTISIYNSLGIEVYKIDLSYATFMDHKVVIDLHMEQDQWPNGTYFILYNTGTSVIKGRLVVLK